MDIDIRTQREINFQTIQTVFHVIICFLVAYFTPDTYWLEYNEQTMDTTNNHVPWGVVISYGMSTSYHSILYFWDPMSDIPLRARHIITVMFGTLLFSYGYLGWGLGIMLCNYIFDMWDFIHHQVHNIDRSRVVVMMMTKIHHMVTLALLGWSWISNFTAYGMITLFIHDVTDVPMFVLRIIRRKTQKNTMTMTLVALGVILTWVYYRVWCFGWIIYSGFDRLLANYLHDKFFSGLLCLLGLSILWSFNFYWTSLVIFKAIHEKLLGHEMKTENE